MKPTATHDVLVKLISYDEIESHKAKGWLIEDNRSHHGRYRVFASKRIPRKPLRRKG